MRKTQEKFPLKIYFEKQRKKEGRKERERKKE
jgi:hypothetical protein